MMNRRGSSQRRLSLREAVRSPRAGTTTDKMAGGPLRNELRVHYRQVPMRVPRQPIRVLALQRSAIRTTTLGRVSVGTLPGGGKLSLRQKLVLPIRSGKKVPLTLGGRNLRIIKRNLMRKRPV